VAVTQKEMDMLAQMQDDRYEMSQLEEENISLLELESFINV